MTVQRSLVVYEPVKNFLSIPLTPRRSLSKALGLTSGMYFVGTYEPYIGEFDSGLAFRSSLGD